MTNYQEIISSYDNMKDGYKYIIELIPDILNKIIEITSYPKINLHVLVNIKNLRKQMIELKNIKKYYQYLDQMSIILTNFDNILIKLNRHYILTGDIHVSFLKNELENYYYIFEDHYKIFNDFHILLNNHIKLYYRLRMCIEENNEIDNINKKKLKKIFSESIEIKYKDIYEKNIINIDKDLKDMCSLIFKIKNEYDSIFENFQYHLSRKEKTTEIWKNIKNEFFVLCYRPDLFKKIVLDEKEVEFYN